MRQLVRDRSPGELEKINKEKLLAMGVTDELTNAFLDNRYYSPQDATLLVGELESMQQEGTLICDLCFPKNRT